MGMELGVLYLICLRLAPLAIGQLTETRPKPTRIVSYRIVLYPLSGSEAFSG